MKFLIVDAFSEKLFGGNPAGIVILPKGSDFPSDELMVKTAAELRYSETAFISIMNNNEFRIRYFTPAAEVDLCGHATVGAFCALAHLGIIKKGDTCINHTLAGDLEVEVGSGYVMMDMAEPRELLTISDENSLKELYDVLGTKYEKLDSQFENVVKRGKRKEIIVGDRFPFRYFADAYKLKYYAAFPGCSNDTEASAETIAFLTKRVKKDKIPVVFHIELSNEKVCKSICEATGAKKRQLNAVHNVTKKDFESGVTYMDLMNRNLEVMKEALN